MPRSKTIRFDDWLPSGVGVSGWENFVRLVVEPRWPTAGEPLRIADLFCGCGGLSLGARLAGAYIGRPVEVAVAVDNWADAIAVYRENFSSIAESISQEDLSSFVVSPGSLALSENGKEFAKGLNDVDILIAGPPCQGNSDLNNSSRRNDPRNQLYTVPVALGIEAGVETLIIENVPPVIHASGKVVFDAQRELKGAGYSVYDFVANAVDFGLPQTRRRHILVATKIHDQAELEARCAIASLERSCTIWNFISDLELEPNDRVGLLSRATKMSKDNVARIDYLFDHDLYDLPNAMRPSCHRDKKHSYNSMYGRLRKDGPSQTITSGFGSMGQGRYVHPTRRRLISAHEAARIQGFPDYFDFSSAQNITGLRTMIANAVPPALVAVIVARLLRECL